MIYFQILLVNVFFMKINKSYVFLEKSNFKQFELLHETLLITGVYVKSNANQSVDDYHLKFRTVLKALFEVHISRDY